MVANCDEEDAKKMYIDLFRQFSGPRIPLPNLISGFGFAQVERLIQVPFPLVEADSTVVWDRE
jgi:hypothetical protein